MHKESISDATILYNFLCLADDADPKLREYVFDETEDIIKVIRHNIEIAYDGGRNGQIPAPYLRQIFSSMFQKWIRIIIAETSDINELKDVLRKPSYLPTRIEIMAAFADLNEWTGHCFDKDKPVFEFLNQEYLDALSDYLFIKYLEFGEPNNVPIRILEVAAGDGRLSHFLNQIMKERIPGKYVIIPTDSGLSQIKSSYNVEQIDSDAAVKMYQPDIVIVSWMPYKNDLSAGIRKTDCVKEYILIGEERLCGEPWATWGRKSRGEKEYENVVPPHKADGFEKKELPELSRLQICRCDVCGFGNHSQTFVFRRK